MPEHQVGRTEMPVTAFKPQIDPKVYPLPPSSPYGPGEDAGMEDEEEGSYQADGIEH